MSKKNKSKASSQALRISHSDETGRSFIWTSSILECVVGITNRDTVKKLLKTAQYFQASTEELGQDIKAESMFCSFTQTRGKKSQDTSIKFSLKRFWPEDINTSRSQPETDNVGANRQLKSWGFQSQGTFHFMEKKWFATRLICVALPRLTSKDWIHS